MVCGVVAQRLNEECVQKPLTERTHSEGTSRRTGHRKLHNTAWRHTLLLPHTHYYTLYTVCQIMSVSLRFFFSLFNTVPLRVSIQCFHG